MLEIKSPDDRILTSQLLDGVPANPCARLVSAGRFKAIDTLRSRAAFDATIKVLARQIPGTAAEPLERRASRTTGFLKRRLEELA